MTLSTGTYHVELDGQFADVIGALALANLREEWSRPTRVAVEKHADLVNWIKQSHERRESWVLTMVLDAATKSNQVTISSATKVLPSGIGCLVMEDAGWFDRELAFWGGPEMAALCVSLSEDADAALQRKLPAELSPEAASEWAKGLIASMR